MWATTVPVHTIQGREVEPASEPRAIVFTVTPANCCLQVGTTSCFKSKLIKHTCVQLPFVSIRSLFSTSENLWCWHPNIFLINSLVSDNFKWNLNAYIYAWEIRWKGTKSPKVSNPNQMLKEAKCQMIKNTASSESEVNFKNNNNSYYYSLIIWKHANIQFFLIYANKKNICRLCFLCIRFLSFPGCQFLG